jgi:hypothetical protein
MPDTKPGGAIVETLSNGADVFPMPSGVSWPPDQPSTPELLRVPFHFHTVADVLACAGKLNLPNVLVLSEREDGTLVFLDNDLTLAQANWLLDRMKALLITPNQFHRKDET